MRLSLVLSRVAAMAAVGCCSAVLRADFGVATSSSIETRPAVAYNSNSGKFLVACLVENNSGLGGTVHDLRCQLFNADGTPSGGELYPLGTGYVNALSRPALAYNPNLDIFFVAVAERVQNYDRVIGRFLNSDGSNRPGPDFAFDDSSLGPVYVDGNGIGSVRVACNTLLNEFVVTMQRTVWTVDSLGNPVRQTVIDAQRRTESSSFPWVRLSAYASDCHLLAFAPVAGTIPAGGRYLFQTTLLDSELNKITYVPVKTDPIGLDLSGASNLDAAYGEVEGQKQFLLVWTDDNNCDPYKGLGSGPCSSADQWTGIWGSYIDPLITSYPVPPQNHAFPISAIANHVVIGTLPNWTETYQAPRVSYSAAAKGFFVVWREMPASDSYNDESRSHIRGALVDYFNWGGVPQPPVNIVISDVSGTCPNPPTTPNLWCASEQDPEYPDVAAMDGHAAAVVWQQHWPQDPTDIDVHGDILSGVNTPTGALVSVERNGHTITFNSVTTPGFTSVTIGISGAPPPSGYEQSCDPPAYYDVSTTANYSGPVKVCLAYDKRTCDDDSLRLFHDQGGSWMDVTSGLDALANTVCGNVPNLSAFLLASMPMPNLTIAPVNPNASPVTLSLQWQGTGYFLEEAESVPNWTLTDATHTCAGGICTATDSTVGSIRFYRLRDDSKFPSVHSHPVAYVGVTIPAGWSMTSNPFARVGSANTLNDLFKLSDQNFGAAVVRFSMASGWSPSIFFGTAAGWLPNLELPLGEGVAIATPTATPMTLHMSGPLVKGKVVLHIPKDISIIAPPWPTAMIAGPHCNDLLSLGYPALDWDWTFTFNSTTGFVPYCYFFGLWWSSTTLLPMTPPLSLGEAFWSWRADAADWTVYCPEYLP